MSDFKKYDTKAYTHYHNVRLAKDAEVKEYNGDKFTKVTFVDSSRFDSDAEMWVEINPLKSQAVMASYLEKGDEIAVMGKLTFRVYGDAKDKFGFNLRNGDISFSPGFIAKLKERGWAPGSEEFKGDAPAKKSKSAGKKEDKKAPTKSAKKPIEIDLDDEEAVSGDEDIPF